MKNFRRKLPGTHYNYEALIGSPERLKQLMDMPLSECLSYCEKANTVDPEDAICYLADMYIENCGVSLSMRGFADYCSNYWIKKLEMESNTEMSEKYHGALTLGQILPYVSEKYHDGLLDEYDSCVMSHKELRNILFEQIKKGL